MTRYLLLLVATIGFAQSKKELKAADERRDKTLFAVTANPKKFNGSIQGEYIHDEMFIPVTINGKTYSFLFDTGAITIVSPELAANLGLKEVTANNMLDANGNTSEQKIFSLDQLEISGVSFSNIGCAAMSLDSFSTLLCHKIDGIFGSNIMRLANWKVDYQKNVITFSTDKIQPDSAFETVDFEPNFSGSPVVKMVTGYVRFPAMIDTGNNRSLDMPMEIYKQLPSLQKSKTRASFGRAFLALGGNSDQNELAVLADSLYFGESLLRKQYIRVSPTGPVLVGNALLKQYGQIVLSWKKNQIYLPKQTTTREPDYSFGISPLLSGDRIEVSEIWKNTEAEKSGISVGDTLVKVNGTLVSPATPEIWCKLMESMKEIEKIDVLNVEIKKADGSLQSLGLKRFEVFE